MKEGCQNAHDTLRQRQPKNKKVQEKTNKIILATIPVIGTTARLSLSLNIYYLWPKCKIFFGVFQQTGLSQEKFALKIGMDRRTYFSSVEAVKRNIAIVNFKKIADELGVTLSELFKRL